MPRVATSLGPALAAMALAAVIVVAPGLAIAVAILTPAAALLVWAGVLVRETRRRQSTLSAGRPEEQLSRFRAGRILFYAGLATIGVLQYRVAGLAVSDIAFLAAFGFALAEMATRRLPGRALPTWLVAGLSLFALGAAASTAVNSLAPGESFGILIRFVYLLTVWFWTAAVVLRTPQQIQTALSWFVVGAAVAGAWAVAQKLGLAPVGNAVPPRLPGSTEHVNDLGGLCAVAAVPALALAALTRRVWSYVCLFFVAAGVALSGSIGAVVAVAIALLVALVAKELTRAIVVGVAVGAIGLAFLASQNAFEISQAERLQVVTSRTAEYGQGTVLSRLDVYESAVERIGAQPVLGTGMDLASSTIYSPTSKTRHQVHNLLIGRWYETGILGLIGLLLIVAGLTRTAWQGVLGATSRNEVAVSTALLASVCAFLVFSMTSPALYKRIMLAPAALVVASAALPRRASQPRHSAREGRFRADPLPASGARLGVEAEAT